MAKVEANEVATAQPASPVKNEALEESRWFRALVALLLTQFISACAFGFTAPITPLYIQFLGVTGADQVALWSGLITSITGWTMAISAPLWGLVADKYGRKIMVMRAAFGGAILIGGMGFVVSVDQLFFLRLLQGMTTGVVVAITALVASITPRERLGRSLGMIQTALFAGSSLGPLLGGIMADVFGLRWPFYLTGICLATAGAIVLFAVHEPPIKRAVQSPAAQDTPATNWQHRLAGSLRSMATPTMLAMITILWLTSLAQSIIAPVLPLIIQSLEGAGELVATQTGLIMGVTGITSAVAALWLGRVSERFGYKRMMVICTLGAALIYVPQAFVTTTWQMLTLRGILGIFLGGLGPTSQAVVAEVSPENRKGAAFGMSSSAGALGFALGPLFGAGIAILNYHWVFLATAFLLFIVGIWVSNLRIEGGAAKSSRAG